MLRNMAALYTLNIILLVFICFGVYRLVKFNKFTTWRLYTLLTALRGQGEFFFISGFYEVPRFWVNIIAEDSLYTSSMALVVRLHPQLSGLAIKSRPHRYLTARILYTTKGTRSFQVESLLTYGDIAKNPVPKVKPVVKFPCNDCKKSVRTN